MEIVDRSSEFSPLTAQSSSEVPARSAACLNCAAPLGGPFCSECGQRDIPPYPSTRELVVDAFWELSGWDGRFVSTVKALVQKPGLLTREFLEGRRARYLSPLRLYLLASLVYFVLAASAPNLRIGGKDSRNSFVTATTAVNRPARVGAAASESLKGEKLLTPEERAQAVKDIDRAPSLLRPFLKKAVGDPAGFKRAMVETMPRLLFALLPVFAAIVALFYRRRKYPEHLYFAIHLHAFVFTALCAAELAKFTRLSPLVVLISSLALLAIPIYSTVAFRRVYGGSYGRTIVKEIAIGGIYMVVSIVAIVGLAFWVSLFD